MKRPAEGEIALIDVQRALLAELDRRVIQVKKVWTVPTLHPTLRSRRTQGPHALEYEEHASQSE